MEALLVKLYKYVLKKIVELVERDRMVLS